MSGISGEVARGRTREALDSIKQSVANRAPRLLQFGIVAVVWSYVVGAFGLSFLWLVLPGIILWLVWREQRQLVVDGLVNEISQRLFRQRAFRKAESAEWVNIIVNRWWACSSESLFETFTSNLNPLLNDFKPGLIDSIELTDIQLGGHTPFIKDVSVLEVPLSTMGNPEVQVLNPESSQLQPPNLAKTPCKHQVIINATVGFAAPNAQLTFKTKVKTVGAVLAIQLENFHFNAQTQLVLTMDSDAPFPHFTNVSFTFLTKPDVWLNIRVLKGLQIMQLPIIKNWLHSLIMDSLKETLVDPYRYSMDITNKENDSMVSKGDQAVGVVTVVVEGQASPTADNITSWCTVRLGDQKYKTAVSSSRTPWKSAFSFLCHSPQEESLLLKVLTRKMMRKSTLVEHMTSLAQLAPRLSRDGKRSSSSLSNTRSISSDQDDSYESVSRKHTLTHRGGQLSLDISYSPLQSIADLTSEAQSGDPLEPSSRASSPDCYSGVMYVCMHSASNLLAMDDDGTSDPYCVLMANKRKVFTSSFQANTLDPTWEQGVEFFTGDYRKARLTFLLYDWDGRVSGDDFLGMASMTLKPGETTILHRDMDLSFHPSDSLLARSAPQSTGSDADLSPDLHQRGSRFSSAFNKLKSIGVHEGKVRIRSSSQSGYLSLGSVRVSIIFRPVPSVSLSETRPQSVNTATPEEVAQLALQGGLNLARLEGTGNGEATVPDHVAYGLASPAVMHVTLHQARDLISKDMNGKSDPYCVVKIGSNVRYKTRVIPKTLFPAWEESFTMECLKGDQKLSVECLDKDTLSDDSLGTMTFDANLISNCVAGPGWYTLQDVSRGSLQLSFKIEQAIPAAPTSSDDSSVVNGSNYLMQASAGSSRMNSGSQIGIQLPDDSTSSERSSTGMTSAERHENSLGIGSIAVAKGRALQIRQSGHMRTRSAEFPMAAPPAGLTDSPGQSSSGSKQLISGSYNDVNSSEGDLDQFTADMDKSAAMPAEADGGLRRRPNRSLGSSSANASFNRPNNGSHLFFLSGTVIKADGLKGEADSLELYVKIRLNSRSLAERPQPFSRGPEIYKTRRIKGTLTPEWRETFQVEEASVSNDSLLTLDLKSGKKTTIGTQTIVLDKFMEGLSQKSKWLDMGNGARLELSLACQHAPPSPNSRQLGGSLKRGSSFFKRKA